jgi:hypothetical protein
MAEQEVIKHTKKVIDISMDRNTGFWHKIKDFLLEIFIIVFAVSLSISFHNWSEHRNEQNQVKTFLLGLRQDILEDLADAKGDLLEYDQYRYAYTWLSSFDEKSSPNGDTLRQTLNMTGNTTSFRPHSSRFTGFLSAGKIMNIENDSLTQDILNYYQEVIPDLKSSEEGWFSVHNRLRVFLEDNVTGPETDKTKLSALTTPKGRHLTRLLIPWPQLIERYHTVIDRGNTIIAEIDKTYPREK